MLKSIYEISQRLHCRWLLVEWGGRQRGTFTLNNPIGWLRDHLHCNLGIFKDAGIRYIRKILVLLKDDKNDNLVLDTAYHLAIVHKARITLCRNLPFDATEEQMQSEKRTLSDLAGLYLTTCDVLILNGKDEAQRVVEVSIDFDLIIFGVSDYKKTGITGRVFGTAEDVLTQQVHCSVLKVQTINGGQFS